MAVNCSFCGEQTSWAEVLADDRILCPACKPCLFFEDHLSLANDYAGQKFILMPWARTVVRDILGTIDDDGRRQYQDVYLEIPKGNAKTTIMAGMVLYFLATADKTGTEIYSAATAKDQAANLFRAAEQMVYASPTLSQLIEVVPSSKRMFRRDDPTSFYRALSSEAKASDGMVPSVVIRDELHLWHTKKHLELNEILERSGGVKRKSPLVIDITTAGKRGEAPLCWARHEYTRRIQKGVIKDRRFYGRIWGANEERMRSDPEYWSTRQARVEANPSHEDNGGYISDESLLAMVLKAQNDPAKKAPFCRYTLNFWDSNEGSVIDYAKWLLCDGGINFETHVEHYDEAIGDAISKWDLEGQDCFLGLDLGTNRDLTALVAVFPPAKSRTQWAFLCWFWTPEMSVATRKEHDKVDYDVWVERGFITATPAYRTNPKVVIPAIMFCRENFSLRVLAYDPKNADALVMEIQGETDIEVFEVPQYTSHLNMPTKWLLQAYLDGEIMHGNNPVFNWMADNLGLDRDSAQNVKPMKAGDEDPKKIDGISAAVTALRVALGFQDEVFKYTKGSLKSVGAPAPVKASSGR